MANKINTLTVPNSAGDSVTYDIDALSLGGTSASSVTGHGIYYGTCATAAATAAKVVTLTDSAGFSLKTGAVVIVKFTNANSASNPTLNVNSTGAKAIMRYGTTVVSTGTTTSGWLAGAVQVFVYDGTNWVRDYWNNTTYSNAAMGTGYATCTTAAATTAKVGSLSSYALSAGGIVSVKFTYAVPASATLNINSKGAKAIYYRGAAITANIIKAGDLATFIYNGSYYHLIAIDRWQKDLDDCGKLASTNTWTGTNTFEDFKVVDPTNSQITASFALGQDTDASDLMLPTANYLKHTLPYHTSQVLGSYPVLLNEFAAGCTDPNGWDWITPIGPNGDDYGVQTMWQPESQGDSGITVVDSTNISVSAGGLLVFGSDDAQYQITKITFTCVGEESFPSFTCSDPNWTVTSSDDNTQHTYTIRQEVPTDSDPGAFPYRVWFYIPPENELGSTGCIITSLDVTIAAAEVGYTTYELKLPKGGPLASLDTDNYWTGAQEFDSSVRFYNDITLKASGDSDGWVYGMGEISYESASSPALNERLTLPMETGTLATQEWVQENVSGGSSGVTYLDKTVSGSAGSLSVTLTKKEAEDCYNGKVVLRVLDNVTTSNTSSYITFNDVRRDLPNTFATVYYFYGTNYAYMCYNFFNSQADTESTSASLYLSVIGSGSITPLSNAVQNFGSSSRMWANVYTSNLRADHIYTTNGTTAVTVPNTGGTLATLSGSNTWTSSNTFTGTVAVNTLKSNLLTLNIGSGTGHNTCVAGKIYGEKGFDAGSVAQYWRYGNGSIQYNDLYTSQSTTLTLPTTAGTLATQEWVQENVSYSPTIQISTGTVAMGAMIHEIQDIGSGSFSWHDIESTTTHIEDIGGPGLYVIADVDTYAKTLAVLEYGGWDSGNGFSGGWTPIGTTQDGTPQFIRVDSDGYIEVGYLA